MRFLGILNRSLPDSRWKNRLKHWFLEKIMFRWTRTANIYHLKDGIDIKLYPLLLTDAGVGDFELIGYEKHYAIKPGDVVIDGGGFLGVFSLFAAKKVGLAGRVITYEPDPALANLVERNVRLNGLANVTLVRKGLWSRTAELSFDVRGNAGAIDFRGNRTDVLRQRIKVVSLDEEVERLQLSRVNLIKMNIEGAEIEAIQGCQQLMHRYAVNFAIAANHLRDGQQTASFVQQFLAAQGYETVIDYPQHLSVYAWPPGPRFV